MSPNEKILCAAASELAKLKKLWYRTSKNAVLLPPILTDIALTNRETAAEALLMIFAKSINDQEVEIFAEILDEKEESGSDNDNKKSAKTRSMKDATARNAMDGLTANCEKIITLLQVVALKAPQVQAVPLSLQSYKRATGWFCQWEDRNLKNQAPPNKATPQDQSGQTGFLSGVATRLQNKEAL